MPVELHTETEDEYLTIPEFECLIQNLSEAEILKLGQIAKKYTTRCLMDANELLNEAIIVTASGKRKFPRKVQLLAFFAGTMKSIASNEKRKLHKKISPIDDDPANDPILNEADKNIHIENEAIANQELTLIYDIFKNDDDVTMLLMAKCDGLSPDEICETEGWDRTKYNAIQKRLRRALNKRFPNGRET
jgi:DNA-directed RNA polymerase specialized sigma24 family protein